MSNYFLDCLYSGHTLLLVMLACYWWKQKTPFKWISIALSCAGIYVILANRAHYTADVMIAVYVALLLDYCIDAMRRKRSKSKSK